MNKLKVRRLTTMEKYLLLIIIAYSIAVSVMNPSFLRLETLFDLLKTSTGTVILATGVLMVIISGGIDVSFTTIAIVSGYSSVILMLKFSINNLIFGLFIAALIGGFLGAVNACLIHHFKLQTLIVTLGTSSVFYGLMTTFIGTKSIPMAQMPQSLVRFGSTNILNLQGEAGNYGLSVFIIVVLVCIIATWFILYRTMLGRFIFAIGNDEIAASRIGINIFATKLFVYIYMGVLAGIMGIIYFSELKMVNPISLVGTELMVIAAVVIGGAKLTGGEGTIFGALLGVTIIQLFKSTLIFLGLSTSWNELFTGIVLIISICILYYKERKRNIDKLNFTN